VEMEEIVQVAKWIALKQGYHTPMLFLDGTIAKAPVILETFPNEHEEKIKYLFVTGQRFSKKPEIGKLNKVFFVMEAWMGTNLTIRPSCDPKRIEVLVIVCLDMLKKEQTVRSLEYVRDANGKLIELKEASIPDNVIAESPLLPAFVAGYTSTGR
jgi:hypothetical protein